jgi:hypothetical protein
MSGETLETFTGVDEAGNVVEFTMIIPGPGPSRKGATFTKWGRCVSCDFVFPLSELETHNGKLYCSQNGCNKDFQPLR